MDQMRRAPLSVLADRLTFFPETYQWHLNAAPFRHIRSAILKMSQPRTAKPTAQKSITELTAIPFPLFTQCLRFYRPDGKFTNRSWIECG